MEMEYHNICIMSSSFSFFIPFNTSAVSVGAFVVCSGFCMINSVAYNCNSGTFQNKKKRKTKIDLHVFV